MELKQVKENVRKMVSLGAPMEDIDGYIAAAGYTVEDVKNYQPPQYSGMEKTKYTLRAAGEGMAMGMADIVAGGTNVLMNDLAKVTHGQNLKERAGGLWDLFRHTNLMDLKGQKELYTSDNFKRGRADFVQEQDEFKQAYPGLNMAGELGGGLVSGVGGAGKAAGAKILSKLGKWGAAAAAGAGSGAAYGFGTGLTRDADTLDPVQGAKEGAQGAFWGGAFGLAAPATFLAAGKLANRLNKQNRAYRQLSKAAKGKLEESIETGTALIDNADKKALRLIEGANVADDEASEILGKYADSRMAALQEEAQGTLDNMFGKKGFDTLLEESRENAQKLAEPLYAKAFTKGRVNIQLDPMQQLMAQELRQNPYSAYAFRNAANNDFRFLDAVKRGLDYKISGIEEAIAKKSPIKPSDATSLPALKQSRARLLETLDNASPHYRLARSVAEQGIKFEEDAQAGQRAFLDPAADIANKVKTMGRGGRTPDWEGMRQKARGLKTPGAAERRLAQINLLEDIYNAAARAERSGYRAGAGQALRKLLEGSGANWENYYQKIFNRNRLNKLQAMGVDTGKFASEIEKGKKTANNMRNLFRGSQTAEREQDKLIFKPVEFFKKKAAEIISKAWVVSPQDIARMSIDPGYAALMRQAAAQLPKAAYTDISGAGGAFAHIAGPLTRREKDAMRRGVQEHLMQNVRGTSVYNEALGRDIHFSRPGIDKAINSSQDLEKLKMTQYAAEIAKRGRPYQASRRRGLNVYDYLMTPVNIDGKRTSAATTLRNGYFYNVNPMDYAIKKKPQDLVVPLTKQGPLEAQNPGRLSQKPTGAIAKGIHSIANKAGKVKGNKPVKPFDMRDFLILLSRPYTLGTAAAISGKNTLADKSGLAFAQALNDMLDYPYTRARQTQKREDK